MNAKNKLLGAALVSSFFCASVIAATETIPLHPLELPVLTDWVQTRDLVGRYQDLDVLVSLTVDTAGRPSDIKLLAPRDYVLEHHLQRALAQCRFTPARQDGVPVATKVKLPLRLNSSREEPQPPLEIGALKFVVAQSQQAAAAPSENTHPAMFHVSAIKCDGQTVLMDGTASATVRERLGPPNKNSEQFWVYPKFSGMSAEADSHGCDTILIAFENERIAAIALVNDRAKAHVADHLKYSPDYVAVRLLKLHQATALASN